MESSCLQDILSYPTLCINLSESLGHRQGAGTQQDPQPAPHADLGGCTPDYHKKPLLELLDACTAIQAYGGEE